MMKFIYCAGGIGRNMMDFARRQRNIKNSDEAIFFIDDSLDDGIEVYQTRSYTFTTALNTFSFSDLNNNIVIANGEPLHRRNIFDRTAKHSIELGQLIDPSACISETAFLGAGILVAPMASICSNVKVHQNVLINNLAHLGHDVQIGAHTVISPMVIIGGASIVGQGVYIGMGANIREGVKVGSHSIVGMGAVVVNDIPDEVIVMGNPARVVRKITNQKVFK
jgi:sugar O-acyltransferase (sialic acid O-acetyltransferase NeuD family)